ncbi:TA system antitoxin ParD family protein [Variovorax paradoxus]|jgi:hypothetical protein|uniref:TA system antitoxin ParD family protein n=1 Tax=Variovorax paradoxus TaxID=34073 RepID=UPI0030CC1510
MAQSIRISDELYSLAQSTGSALGRPIAQQMEHWARLGAALEAAGLSSIAAMQLLGQESKADQLVRATLGETPLSGARRLRRLQAKDADQVSRGQRSSKSLHAFTQNTLQGFTFKRQQNAEPDEGEGW